jgi:hypothetical protein
VVIIMRFFATSRAPFYMLCDDLASGRAWWIIFPLRVTTEQGSPINAQRTLP